MKQRALSILMTLCMLLTLLPTAALAAEGDPADPATCTCETACAQGSMNANCTVCGAEGATVEGCGQYVAPIADTTCFCTVKCADQVSDSDCAVCTSDISKCMPHSLTPSATNLTGGDSVTFTSTIALTSVEGTRQDGTSDDTQAQIKADMSGSNSKVWTAELPNETAEYIFRGLFSVTLASGATAWKNVECTVSVTASATPTTYTVTFDGNGSTGGSTAAISTTGTFTFPANGFTAPTGKAFAGWSDVQNAAENVTLYQPNETYAVEENTTFYAIWEDHTHSYSSVWLYDESCHWHECSCGSKSGEAAHSGPAATATEPQTCTVCRYVIAPAKGYTLTINYAVTSSGITVGSDSETVTGITSGEVVDLSKYWSALAVTGSDGKTYYFAGFTKKGEIALINSVTVTGDIELEAAWTTEKQITVDLNPNGGTLPYARTRENYDESIYWMNREHIPVRAGYEFAGWSLANDGTADSGDTQITADCTLYAVWQQYSPSYDDDYYDDPPPASIPVSVGGDYDAILRDGMIIVRGDDPISGTLDLGKTDAEAIRLPADAVKASTGEGNAVTIKYPGGTSALITGSGLVAAGDALRSGENLQIAVRPVDAGALPEELTTPPEDDGPFGGIEAEIHTSVFSAAGIENIEDRLNTLGLINGNTDTAITEEEFEYLYHYLTTDELMTLRNKLNESAHFEHHQKAVDWLDEMIERDGIQVELNTGHLDESGIRSKLEAVGYTGSGLPLGLLRQADLDMKQLEYIKNLMQEYIEVLDDDADELVLAWAKEAIAQKELEASYAQMDSLIEEARSTNGSYTGLNDVKDAAKDMTTDELERFLAKASAAKSSDSGTLPVLALGALDKIIEYLNSELEARQAQEDAQDAPTYINVGGERAVFVGAIEADVKAVRASGSTRNIEILADRSNAFAWSTIIQGEGEQQNEEGRFDNSIFDALEINLGEGNIRAYKVLDDGTLEAKAAKVTVNADGTLTLSAMSDGNSTYIFVLEPNPYTDVDEDDWYYDAAMTMDQRLLMQGTTTTTFGGGVTTSRGMIATILYRLDGEPDADLENVFKDVADGSYYHDAILWAEENGIVTGYGGGVFGPDDPITREQLAAMLYRYAQYKGYDVSVGGDTNILSYNDAFEISEYAIPAMQWACGEGIINGDNGYLMPEKATPRSHAAAMLARFLEDEE